MKIIYSNKLHKMHIENLEKEVEEWLTAQCHNIYEHYYLWYVMEGGCAVIATAAPNTTFSLALRLETNWTKEIAEHKIYTLLGTLHVLLPE